MNIKTIIKVAQVAIVYISIKGIAIATPPSNKVDSPSLNTSTMNGIMPPRKNTYHSFMLDSDSEFLKYKDSFSFQQYTTQPTLPKKFTKYTFTVTAHHNRISYSQDTPTNTGLASAYFGFSRAAHNEGLQIIDSDASNEHAQLNLRIQMDSILIIDKYMHLFPDSGTDYFPLKSDYFNFRNLNKTLFFFKNMNSNTSE
ncbi:MAG: hypothetical protein methR_P2827 [Methyloprofundus sp.]|nr:MAG: hypothetical protein methR_P2827 [Methyloprofundus sp.]